MNYPSLIRLDNAKFNCAKLVTTPSACKRTKTQLHNIQFAAKSTVATLRMRLAAHIDTVEPEIVQLATQYGHVVLYAPPYHCDLQPIEMVGSRVKEVKLEGSITHPQQY